MSRKYELFGDALGKVVMKYELGIDSRKAVVGSGVAVRDNLAVGIPRLDSRNQ